jgi:hypothetical protein
MNVVIVLVTAAIDIYDFAGNSFLLYFLITVIHCFKGETSH